LIVYGFLILVTLYFLPRGIMGLVKLNRKSQSEQPARGASVETSYTSLPPTTGVDLRIESLSHSFGGLTALSDVSFDIKAGTIHALIGPNGAGKTTLINIVSGTYGANAGRIIIDGVEARMNSMHVAARHGIVRTFQTLKLFGDMTVIEHVLVGMAQRAQANLWDAVIRSRRGRDEAARQLDQARAILELLGIAHLEQVPATDLAYGHRRLAEIARALAARPRILLLDEPAAGLVVEEIRALATLIRKLKDIGMTILLVEHHMDLVLSVSDWITVLDHGAVIADDVPSAIRGNERVIAAYLGPSHAAA
jgi:ABC-type branched-subunit amino acid transport system ATPase component